MSGGFFRGTSAEQDTRFSNKQAKLLKSQKFAPELDHVVDIAKVKMDVFKPWIATRVTELLGFEDEVLINFINGLLEGKDINGKQIQIQLTGFMEKHTGKFMKELWSLLLSAQNNASGVPQQFLDAKEEETRKKKEELDRIGNEMQKMREKEQVHSKRDGGVVPEKDPSIYFDDDKQPGKRNGGRNRDSKSPKSADRHPPHRERYRSRNLSNSPPSRQHSVSSDRRYHSPQRSVSPMRRRSDESLSPRQRSPKRRSTSCSHNRSLSPERRRVRSSMHRRVPSPGRRISHSRLQRRSRSPRRRRSPSPWRRRSPSPWQRRSRSPRKYRSPSPRHRRSPSPWRRRSPCSRRRRSPSPMRKHQRTSHSSSISPVTHRPSSPSRNRSQSKRRSPSLSRGSHPLRRRSPPASGSPVKRRVSVTVHLRSPNQVDRSSSPHSQVSLSPVLLSSSSLSDGGPRTLKRDPLQSPRFAPRSHDQSSRRSPPTPKGISVTPDAAHKGRDIGRRMASNSPHSKDHTPSGDREEKAYKRKSSQRSVHSPRHGNMDTPEKSSCEHYCEDNSLRKEKEDIRRKNKLAKDAIGLRNSAEKDSEESLRLMKKDDLNSPTLDSSGSEGIDKHRAVGGKKRKHRKSSRQEIGSDSGDDSGVEDRKEAKRRRKEEKKLRKEERRHRREERHSRKEEKQVHKRKRSKDRDSMLADSDKHENGINACAGKGSYSDDKQGTELEKKRLENELREKALQNIRAKKGMGR